MKREERRVEIRYENIRIGSLDPLRVKQKMT
jgi:hypothetical protein